MTQDDKITIRVFPNNEFEILCRSFILGKDEVENILIDDLINYLVESKEKGAMLIKFNFDFYVSGGDGYGHEVDVDAFTLVPYIERLETDDEFTERQRIIRAEEDGIEIEKERRRKLALAAERDEYERLKKKFEGK